MQNPLGAAQTAQWSWILQTVWGWVWGGLSWILDWQAYVFQFVLSGSSFWGAVGRFLFLFFPAVVLVAGANRNRNLPTAPQNELPLRDRKSTRLNYSHAKTSYAVIYLKKKKNH